jgi:hypothetical protein
MKIWKSVFFSLQAAGRGFSRNPTVSTPIAGLEEILGLMSFFQIIDIKNGKL